jgi:pimeloyl-ACP methyl ester carboxylesterase
MFGGMPVPLGHRTTGSPGGLPVVLLHGLGDDATTWDRFAGVLDRHAIAFDLRGHGTSPRPGEYTPDAMVDDVVAALEPHDRVDLVGHSMGGHVAALFTIRHPGRVRRLVLEDTVVPPRDGAPLPDDDPPERPAEPIGFDWDVVTAMRPALRAPNPQWWHGIEQLATPTLWISGGPRSHLDPARVAAAAAVMPRATVATIPVGHLIHDDAPEDFARVVLAFLSADGEPATLTANPAGEPGAGG